MHREAWIFVPVFREAEDREVGEGAEVVFEAGFGFFGTEDTAKTPLAEEPSWVGLEEGLEGGFFGGGEGVIGESVEDDSGERDAIALESGHQFEGFGDREGFGEGDDDGSGLGGIVEVALGFLDAGDDRAAAKDLKEGFGERSQGEGVSSRREIDDQEIVGEAAVFLFFAEEGEKAIDEAEFLEAGSRHQEALEVGGAGRGEGDEVGEVVL